VAEEKAFASSGKLFTPGRGGKKGDPDRKVRIRKECGGENLIERGEVEGTRMGRNGGTLGD